jgi:stage V sporulation protein AC
MKPKPKPTPEQKQYGKLVKERMPKTKLGFDCLKAFVVGGLICMLGQLVNDVGKYSFPVNEAVLFHDRDDIYRYHAYRYWRV